MPTVAELNEAAADTPVFVLFAYSQVLLNKAGVAALTLTPESKPTEGDSYEFVDGGAIIRGTAAVNSTVVKLPPLSDADDQLNSTQRFFRELNRFGMTSTVDAGTRVAYPDDFQAVATMATRPKFPMRISNFLTAQNAGTELKVFEKWTAEEKRGVNRAASRLNGYVLEGAGEVLLFGAHDYENFMAPRPEWNDWVAYCTPSAWLACFSKFASILLRSVFIGWREDHHPTIIDPIRGKQTRPSPCHDRFSAHSVGFGGLVGRQQAVFA